MSSGRLLLLTVWLSCVLPTQAQVPQLIHVQGRVTDNRSNLDGLGEFKFSLVNSNVTLTLWSNDGTGRAGAEPSNSVPVDVDKGVFSVMLGDPTLPHMTPVPVTVFTNPSVQLRIWFRAAGSTLDKPFTVLVPDLRFAAVGYAMFATGVPDGSINAAKLAPNAVGSAALAPGSVNTLHLADGAVTREKLATGAIPPLSLPDGSVTTSKLADQAVTTLKIGDHAVSDRALAGSSVSTRTIAGGAVTMEKIAPGAVIADTIAQGAVSQEKLAASAVGSVQLANASVVTAKLSNGSVTAEKLAPGVALSNLVASGFSGVPSAGIVLSLEQDSLSLVQAGFARSGSTSLAPDRWELRTGFGNYPDFHATVWTGSELIVLQTGQILFGGRYNPLADSWRPVSTNGAPVPRYEPLAVWTSRAMIVWGGYSSLGYHADGGLYDPSRDRWRPMSTNGAPTRTLNAIGIWTGSEMIIWGGIDPEGIALDTGARYDPLTDRWKPVSSLGAPTPRYAHTAVWTGDEMIIWGGVNRTNREDVLLSSGGRYRPSMDAWTATALVDAPPPLAGSPAVWTGEEMLVWGGVGAPGLYTRTGARYNPASNSWRTITTRNAPLHRANHSAVWIGTEMVIWGGTLFLNNSQATDTGARYNPKTDEWFQLTQESAPPPKWGHSAVWLGDGMAIIGGANAPFDPYVLYVWKPSVQAYLYQRP